MIREFRPHVIVTYDENGGYPHPDHIRTHEISMAAFDAAATRTVPETGEPWQPLKLYYSHGFSRARMTAFARGPIEAGLESPYRSGSSELGRRQARRDGAGDHPGRVRRLLRGA